MLKSFLTVVLWGLLVPALGTVASAQFMPDASTRDGRPRREEMPDGIKERLAERRIKEEEKQHTELLDRGAEASKLVEELIASYAAHQAFSSDDFKKLDRIEKLMKKVRDELGGEEDDSPADKSYSMPDALDRLHSVNVDLAADLKKTTKVSVSVSAIENSNEMLKLVRFIRLGKN